MPKHSSGMTHTFRQAYHQAVDIDIMLRIFREHLPIRLGSWVRVDSLTIPKVIPRGRGGLAVQYNITLENPQQTRRDLTLYGYLPGHDEKESPYSHDNAAIIMLDSPAIFIPVFPYDPELQRLPDMFSEDFIVPIIRRCLAVDDIVPVKLENYCVLGYRLGRRCVIRYDVKIGNNRNIGLVAKLFAGSGAKNQSANLSRLENAGFDASAADSLTVPHVYYEDSAASVSYMEFLEGTSLHDLIGSPEFEAGVAAAGRMLNKLQATRIETGDTYTPADEMRTLDKFMVAADVFPELRQSLTRARELLENNVKGMQSVAVHVLSHRDYYDKQILYSADRVTLLDCDNLCMADPALDYANFLAHLKLRALQMPEHAMAIKAAGEVFNKEYNGNRSDVKTRVDWWMASALIRLACLYALRPRWNALASTLIKEASDILYNKQVNFGGTAGA